VSPPKINHAGRAAVAAAGVLVALLALVLFASPDPALAALRSAAGGGGGGGGGFARFISFINRLADYAIPVGAAFGVLGAIWGGVQYQAGNPNAGRQLAMVGIGVGVVLLSKPLIA
jgi:hypothetical protein